jgi:hypothetical protein
MLTELSPVLSGNTGKKNFKTALGNMWGFSHSAQLNAGIAECSNCSKVLQLLLLQLLHTVIVRDTITAVTAVIVSRTIFSEFWLWKEILESMYWFLEVNLSKQNWAKVLPAAARRAGVPVCRCAGVPVCLCAGVPVRRCAGAPVCRCSHRGQQMDCDWNKELGC